MKSKYLIEDRQNSRLILFFTGWSTDDKIIHNIQLPEGYNLMVLWNYSDFTFPEINFNYDEYLVIGWSFGVYAAQKFYTCFASSVNITLLCAINGTLNPVDNEYGIPKDIFAATLDNLSERSLNKFRIRMCGGRSNYESQINLLPEGSSDISALKKELENFRNLGYFFTEEDSLRWDLVVISEKDLIFPPENLKKAWKGNTILELKGKSHLPAFQSIFDKIVRDKQLISDNFKLKEKGYTDNAEVQRDIATNLSRQIKSLNGTYNRILEIGSGSGFLTQKINEIFPKATIDTIDIAGSDLVLNGKFYKEDAEITLSRLRNNEYDLIVSSSSFQWFHSPKKVLEECHRILKDRGVLSFSFFTVGTYKELSDLTDISLVYHTGESLKVYAAKVGFKLLKEEKRKDCLKFESPQKVLKHIRQTGVNSVRRKNLSVGSTRRLIESMMSSEDDQFNLSYVSEMIILRK